MGPRAGFATMLRPAARHTKGHNVMYNTMILIHHQVAHYAVELDRDLTSGLKMVAAGFRDAIIDIVARDIGVMCVFDRAKLTGKIANHSRTLHVTWYRVMLESLRSEQLEHVMMEQETKATEIRYLEQCSMVNEDMILSVIDELEGAGHKWSGALY